MRTGTQILFEGKSRIGRVYRVTGVGADVLLIDRQFDHAPGKWHREGAVRLPVENWEWALGRHIAWGGDGLEYLPSDIYEAMLRARARLVVVSGASETGKTATLNQLALLDPALTVFTTPDGRDTLRQTSDLPALRAALAYSQRIAVAVHATPDGLVQRMSDLFGRVDFLGVSTIAVHNALVEGQLLQTISLIDWRRGTSKRLSERLETLAHELVSQGLISHDAAASHVPGYLH